MMTTPAPWSGCPQGFRSVSRTSSLFFTFTWTAPPAYGLRWTPRPDRNASKSSFVEQMGNEVRPQIDAVHPAVRAELPPAPMPAPPGYRSRCRLPPPRSRGVFRLFPSNFPGRQGGHREKPQNGRFNAPLGQNLRRFQDIIQHGTISHQCHVPPWRWQHRSPSVSTFSPGCQAESR